MKEEIKKLVFYLGLSVFVAILLYINHLIGLLGGALYILVWHFVFDKKKKELKNLSEHELSQNSSHIKSADTKQDARMQGADTFLKSVDTTTVISVILILVSIGFFIYASSKYYLSLSGEAVEDLSGIFILSLIVASIVVFIVEKLTKKKKFTEKITLLIFALIFSIVTGFNSYSKLQEVKVTSKFIQEALNIFSGKQKEDYSKNEYREFAPILTILNDYEKQMDNLWEEMENEIGSQNIDNILSQEVLSSPYNIQDALVRLDNTQKIYDKYKILYKNKMKELKEELSKVDISPDLKQSFIEGYIKSSQEATAMLDEMLDTEKESIIASKELLNFLLKKQGEYEFQNEQIAFYKDLDINQYNNFVSKINSLAKKEQSLLNSYQQKLKEAENKLKRDLAK